MTDTLSHDRTGDVAFLESLVSAEFSPFRKGVEIDQVRINEFADATGDQQWIHVDEERAKREAPGGTVVAHGFLTISLVPAFETAHLLARVQKNNPHSYVVHVGGSYQLKRAVPVDSTVSCRGRVAKVEPQRGGTALVFYEYEIRNDTTGKIAATGHLELVYVPGNN